MPLALPGDGDRVPMTDAVVSDVDGGLVAVSFREGFPLVALALGHRDVVVAGHPPPPRTSGLGTGKSLGGVGGEMDGDGASVRGRLALL